MAAGLSISCGQSRCQHGEEWKHCWNHGPAQFSWVQHRTRSLKSQPQISNKKELFLQGAFADHHARLLSFQHCSPTCNVLMFLMFSSAHAPGGPTWGPGCRETQKPQHRTQDLISCRELRAATLKNAIYSNAWLTHQPRKELGSFMLQSPGELDPGTSQQPFLTALKVTTGIPKQACLKPCSPWDTFPVPRTAGIFTYSRKSPLGLQQMRHLSSCISSLGQDLAAQTTPGASFLTHTSLGGQMFSQK